MGKQFAIMFTVLVIALGIVGAVALMTATDDYGHQRFQHAGTGKAINQGNEVPIGERRDFLRESLRGL